MERIVVVGGNAAGMTAASRAKRLRPELDITILELSRFISYSICGLPYYLADLVREHEDLVRYSPRMLEDQRGIKARTGVRVEQIQTSGRAMVCLDTESNRRFTVRYDRAVVSTGYVPRVPEIEGQDLGLW